MSLLCFQTQDKPEILEQKCLEMAAAINRSSHLIVYTGAGISTAADIPDYRGPNGVWTMKDKGIQLKYESTYLFLVIATYFTVFLDNFIGSYCH